MATYIASSPWNEAPVTIDSTSPRQAAAEYAIRQRGWNTGEHEVWVQVGTELPTCVYQYTLRVGE